ncbi:hypothetical protein [Hymenobacter volaticus]|uniref:hypothetical protein n=1 Tax=Hymenobacter volaticus TaxID=2932254 RepID=UPI001FD70FC7|nr:hypothetical protein [Hymenobacter volaticus]
MLYRGGGVAVKVNPDGAAHERRVRQAFKGQGQAGQLFGQGIFGRRRERCYGAVALD